MLSIKASPCKVTWSVYMNSIKIDTLLTKWEATASMSKFQKILDK